MTYLIPVATKISAVPDYSSYAGVDGYHLDFASSTLMFLRPGYARDFGTDAAITFSGLSPDTGSVLYVDLTVLGAGGCYPHLMSSLTLANDTVFGIYVIGDSSGVGARKTSAMIATSTDFVLPAGYNTFRRVGLCYVDSGTKTLIKWIQAGNGNDRQYTLQDAVRVLNAGSATTFTDIDLTAGDGVVPPGHANYVQLLLSLTAAADAQTLSIEPSVLTSTTNAAVQLTACAAGTIAGSAEIVAGIAGTDVYAVDTNAEIKYKVSNSGAAATIYVAGFTDSLSSHLF